MVGPGPDVPLPGAETAVFNATNFNWPIAPGPGATGVFAGWLAYKPFPCNTTAMTTKVNFFLCPSDGQAGQATLLDGVTTFGGTNYHFCTGDGQPGSGHVGDAGDPTNGAGPADGVFILGPPQSVATITDGSSNTVAGSEQLIGPRRRDRDLDRRRLAPAARPPAGRRLRRDQPVARQRPVDRLQRRRRRLAVGQGLRLVGRRHEERALQPLPHAQLEDLRLLAVEPPPRPGHQGGPEQPSRRRERPCSATATSVTSRTPSASPPGGRWGPGASAR